MPTGSTVVVAEIRNIKGVDRLVIVALGQVDASDVMTTQVIGGETLPGVRQSGRFGFYRVEGDVAAVRGLARTDTGQRAGHVTELAALPFDGYAIGGVSVGEPEAERRAVVEWTAPALPEERPRYLMGVGTPEDLAHAVEQGIDLFDCVLPARNGRHGLLFTRDGLVRIKNAAYRDDPRPLDPGCSCPVCSRVPRALLHHLVRAGEITGAVYGTLHNLRYFLDFMADLRQAIGSRPPEVSVRNRAGASAGGNRSESPEPPSPGSADSGGPGDLRP